MTDEDYWRLQTESARAALRIAVRTLQEIADIYDRHENAFSSAECEEMADLAKEALKKIV